MTRPTQCSLSNQVRTLHGEDSVKQLQALLVAYGVHAPLYIASRSASNTGIMELLGSGWTAEDQGTERNHIILSAKDVSKDTLVQLRQRFISEGHDGIVALGGGSIIDSAKILKLLVARPDASIEDLEGLSVATSRSAVPLIAIPTTVGSGSGATNVAYLRDTDFGRPLRLHDDTLYCEVSILDPKMSKASSSIQTAMGVASIFSRAIHALSSELANPFSESFAIQALRHILAHAYRVVHTPHDLEARAAIAIASQLAGMAASLTGGSTTHGIAIAISYLTDVPYGLAMRILLPHCLRFEMANGYQIPERLRNLIESEEGADRIAMDDPIPFAAWASRYLDGLTVSLNPPMPSRFHDIPDQKDNARSLSPQRLEEIATVAHESYDMLTSTAKPSVQDIIRILEAAYWNYDLDLTRPEYRQRRRRGTYRWNVQSH